MKRIKFNEFKWFGAFFNLYWIGFTLATLVLTNGSAINFLLGIQSIGNRQPNYIIAFAEFIRAILHGWLFFGVYWKGSGFFKVPEDVLQNQKHYFDYSIKELFFVIAWSDIVAETTDRIVGLHANMLPDLVFYILIVIVLIWTIIRLYILIRHRKEERRALIAIPDLNMQAKAFNKISQRLDLEEQDVLRSLVYENNATTNFSVPRVVWIAMSFALIALVVEIAQELFQRF